jgi:hypothetical protein
MKWRLGGGWVIFYLKYQFEKHFWSSWSFIKNSYGKSPNSTFLNQGFRQVQVLETMLIERSSNCLCLSKVPLCEFPRHSLDSRDFTCLAMDGTGGTFQVKLDNYKSFPMNSPRVVAQSKAISFKYLRSIEY